MPAFSSSTRSCEEELETGEFSAEGRDEQFAKLAEGQSLVLDVQVWHDFLKVLIRAGYRSGAQITSKMGLIYTYALYLIGKRDFGVDPHRLRNVIAGWFFMTSLTGRYTNSPESVMERDLARLRDVEDADGFIKLLDGIIEETLTGDYWTITLPGALAATGGLSRRSSPTTRRSTSSTHVSCSRSSRSRSYLDPRPRANDRLSSDTTSSRRRTSARIGIKGGKQNRIANLALVEWPDNAKISDEAPSQYWPGMAARFEASEAPADAVLARTP